MIYVYDLTLEDFKAAQRLHIRHSRRSQWTFIFWHRVLPIISLCCLVLVIRDMGWHHFSYSPLTGGILCGVAWIGLFCFLMRPFMIRRAFRALRADLKGSHSVELELTNHLLISRIPGKSEGRFERAAVTDFAEDEAIALVYVGKKKFIFIPKRAMPENGWQELRAWIEREKSYVD